MTKPPDQTLQRTNPGCHACHSRQDPARNMKRFLTLLIGTAFLCSCAATALKAPLKDSKPAEQTWNSLGHAITSGDRSKIQSFVGKAVGFDGGFKSGDTFLELQNMVCPGQWWSIRVSQPPLLFRTGQEVRTARNFGAAVFTVHVVGIVRSIDRRTRTIVVDPISTVVGDSI